MESYVLCVFQGGTGTGGTGSGRSIGRGGMDAATASDAEGVPKPH